MDELTLLRRLDADTPAPSKAALTDAFDALTERMDTAEQRGRRHVPARRRSRTRRGTWIGATSVGVLALTAALVLTDIVGPAGLQPGASAEAAAVLDRAAARTIHTADPVVGPGQFLAIRTDSLYMSSGGGDPERPLRWLRRGSQTVYIPLDQHGEWTMTREIERPVEFFSAAAKKAALDSYASWAAAYDGRPELLRAPEGNFSGSPAGEYGFDDLPRDPRVLLNRIYRITLGQGQSPEGVALDWIATQLRSGAVPADLRAALYRAATLIPGVTVTDREAVLDGRSGIAIGRVEPSTGVRVDVVIDPETGLLIGERDVATRAVDGIPAGKVTGSTAVTTTVVDSAPAGPEHRVQ